MQILIAPRSSRLVGVAETDRKAEEEYAKHVEYFYHKLLHQPTYQIAPPGYSDYKSLLNILTSGSSLSAVQRPVDRT